MESKVIPTTGNEEISKKEAEQVEIIAEKAPTSESKTEEKRCPNCQALLTKEQIFCPECGTSFKKFCPNCNTELQEGQAFCSSCGQKVGDQTANTNADIAQFNAGIEKQKNKKKILPIILGALGICVVALYLIFTIFLNPQHYIEKGNYQTAYKVSSGSVKETILRENIIAVVSADCMDSLKDPASFELRDAWISVKDDSKVVLLKVAANNSYGNTVINYWHYSWDKDDKEYSLLTTFSDFNEEKTYSWDDSDERIEKILKNAIKNSDADYVSGKRGVHIESESIDTINELFENDILEDVTLIATEPQKTE